MKEQRTQFRTAWDRRRWLCVVLAAAAVPARPLPLQAQIAEASAVIAEIRARQPIVLVGHPVWVDFTLYNPTDEVAIVYLSGFQSLDLKATEMGLPLEHVLGGPNRKTLVISDEQRRDVEVGQQFEPPASSVAVRLAPQATVGRRVDVSLYCPTLLRTGRYRIQWRPYDGAIQSNTISVRVAPLKQARIETDYGSMTVRFFYDEAPRHVENFIELAEQGFYDNLTFHRVIPGYLIQGGAPNEEPAAIRPDGRLLEPEFSDRQFVRGTVGMARRPNDPGSGSCQFFICGSRWPELDGQYTAFGELVEEQSFETLDKLMALPVSEEGKPLRKLYVRTVRIMDVPTSRYFNPPERSFSNP